MKRLFSVMIVAMIVLVVAPSSYAVSITFMANLDGPSEFPPNTSPGTGKALVVYDSVAHTLSIDASFQDLLGTSTVAHIHCCVSPSAVTPMVGVAVTPGTLPGFPGSAGVPGVMSGIYATATPIDLTAMSTYTGGFISGFAGTLANAEKTLLAGLRAGEAYFNIHSTMFPGGEIRGFLHPVPEPGTLGLLAAGIVVLGVIVRRRRG